MCTVIYVFLCYVLLVIGCHSCAFFHHCHVRRIAFIVNGIRWDMLWSSCKVRVRSGCCQQFRYWGEGFSWLSPSYGVGQYIHRRFPRLDVRCLSSLRKGSTSMVLLCRSENRTAYVGCRCRWEHEGCWRVVDDHIHGSFMYKLFACSLEDISYELLIALFAKTLVWWVFHCNLWLGLVECRRPSL